MFRPVTLFTGQWADMPLETLCQKAKSFGYDGLELACWGGHFDVSKGCKDQAYCDSRHEMLARHSLKTWAISAHLVGQAVCDRIDERHKAILPVHVWGDGKSENVRKRAAEEMMKTAQAAKRLGVPTVNGFTGSSIWHLLYSFPHASPGMIADGYADFAARWNPILDEFRRNGVRFALEVHPTEIAFDIVSAQRALEALGSRKEFGFNFDASHFGYQGVDYVEFIRLFRERIFHVHLKDVIWSTTPKLSGVFGGHLPFNVESEGELNRISRIAASLKKKAPIALRVNPNVQANTHSKITTGTYENKFGIAYEEIEAIYQRAAHLPYIQLKGIQMHIGSQITTVAPFSKAIRKMLPLVKRLRDRHQLEFFSIGGGIGIVYRPALESGTTAWWDPSSDHKRHHAAGRSGLPLTIELYARSLIPLLKPLGMKILLEPGRFMVGNAGILVTRVEYLKRTGKKNFLIVDAAMNDLIRPAFYDSYHQIIPLQQTSNTLPTVKYDVVGPICESGDYFAKDRELEQLYEGDLIALMSAGAYGFAMASNYNTRPRPAEILISGKTAKLARQRETWKEMIRGEKA